MERTSFTTNRSWILSLLTLVLGLAGFQSTQAQCPAPTNLVVPVATIGENTATLRWTSTDTPMDNCWTLSVGGEGMTLGTTGCPASGQALLQTTICNIGGTLTWGSGVTNATISGSTISATIGGLSPGTEFQFFVSETCDGIAPGANVSGCSASPIFSTLDDQFEVPLASVTTVRPSCPFVSPGYVANGSFTVTVVPSTTCVGTYALTVTPVAGSGPAGSTPPATTTTMASGPAGTFTFTGAGAGSYRVSVSETGTCNFATEPVIITVAVPNGLDTTVPVYYLTDYLGNVLADNDPMTPAGATLNLGTITLPEGECGRQDTYFAYGFDNCDGAITAANAVSASASTTPASISPGTQTSVSPDALSVYIVNVHWSTGNSTVTVAGRDAAGNVANLTLTANIPDNGAPVVSISGSSQVTIPVCATTASSVLSVQVDDACDQSVNFASLSLTVAGATVTTLSTGANYREYSVAYPAAGSYTATANYTDANGNAGTSSLTIQVQQASANQPPVIFANAENASIAACQSSYNGFIYSFTITDDCEAVNLSGLTVTSLPAGMSFSYSDLVNGNNRAMYVEYSGSVTPGTYFPVISYTNSAGQTAQVNPSIVVTQAANQAPDVIVPGNLTFTIPQCASSVSATMAVTITDDCDATIDASRASFSLGGTALTPTYSVASAGYFEFAVSLSAANSGQLLVASYTDGAGNTTTVDALVTVTAQPDSWAPIIVYPAQDIIVNLDACAASSATVVFEATATDNCGVASFNVGFTPGVTGASVIASAGGARVAVISAPGTYTVLLTATDVNGNTRQEDFRIIVTQPARPVDNLACLNNINVTLGPDCTSRLIPDMVLTGNRGCLQDSDFEITVIDSNPANGPIVDGCGDFIYEIRRNVPQPTVGFTGPFAPSNWTVGGAFTDGASVTFTPSTLTLVTGASGPFDGSDPNLAEVDAFASIAMPCSGNMRFDYNWTNVDVNFDWFIIAVNGTIVAQGTANTSGTFNRNMNAGEVLIVAIDDDGFAPAGQVLTISNFRVECAPSTVANFTTCWGNVHTEDKTNPTITCPANTANATVNQDIQFVSGSLATTDPQLDYSLWSCFLEFTGANGQGLRYYDLYSFTVTADDVYTFEFESNLPGGLTPGGNGMAALFTGAASAFNPANPCANIIFQNDQVLGAGGGIFLPGLVGYATTNFSPTIRMSLPLRAGQTYTMYTTSTVVNATGNYTWVVSSDGAGQLAGVPVTTVPQTRPLICNDINQVLFTAPATYLTDRSGNPLPAAQQPGGAAAYNATALKLSYTGRPTVADNCGQLKVTVSDAVSAAGDCGLVTITRTFRVEDKQNSPCGGTPNAAQCTQTITLRKPLMTEVSFPPFTTFLECDESFAVAANGNPSPSVTGYPFIRTAFGFVDLNQTYCNLAAQYEDQPRVDVCEGSYKFVRRWTVLNWCVPGQSRFFLQLIKVGDYTAPTITCPVINDPWGVPQNPITYSTTPFSCTASFAVPLPTVADACSGTLTIVSEIVTDVQVPVLNQYGQQVGTTAQTVVVRTIPNGGNLNVTGIPVGNHRFRYTVTDNCGNTSTQECAFRVLDLIEPNAVIDDQLNVSVGGQSFARLYASDINEGSNDNCGDVTIRVRRATGCASTSAPFGPWGDFVDFSCCDARGSNSRVRIELEVTDGSGNKNVSWMDVLVEDKIRPVCYAPHPVSINCDDLPADFRPNDTIQLALLFNGDFPPNAVDNCSAYVRELAPTVNLHDCGWGTITRNFQAVDASGNTSTNACRQIITVNENHNYWIKFPRDYSANCEDSAPAGVEVEEIGCDLLAVSTTDERFAASGDECYKIFRTYRVINWCEYNGTDAPTVVGRDEDCDGDPGYAKKRSASGAEVATNSPMAVGQLVTDSDFANNGIYVIVRGTTGSAKTAWYDSDTNPSNAIPAAFRKGTSCDGLTNPAGHWVSSAQKPAIASRGYWEYTQHIIVYDNVRPAISVDPVSPFCSYDSPTGTDATCEGPISISFTVSEGCTPEDVTVRAYLDAFSDGTYPYDFNVRLNPNGTRSGNTNVITINGSYPNYTLVSTTPQGLPIGNHRVEIQAQDGCGNIQAVTVDFEIRDCKAPTPICYNGLTVTLMPVDSNNDGEVDGGMAEIWASDFIASPIVDCTPPIKYSLRRAGQAPDINRVGLTFTCADYNAADGSQGTSQVIFVDAWDGAGNRDFCETYVLVQDQLGSCVSPATGSVAGLIRTAEFGQQPIQGVNVALSGPMSQATETNLSGSYLFNNLTTGGDYTITPLLDINPLNGVSTFDLVLISRHILGVQPLDSPYKMIAADVNSSKSITTLDLIQLRRLILALDTEFANNTSWRFIPASYSFPQPNNPWFENFPEVINVNDLAGSAVDQNFRGVKIGDVNGSAIPNLSVVEDRTMNGEFTLNAMDQAVKAGNEYVVTFTGQDMERIRGYQFTMTFDRSKLALVDVVNGTSKEENFGLRFAEEGVITMSWNGEATSKDNLFSLVFRAVVDGQLSEMLGVSSRYTRAEAYNTSNDLMGVSLNFNGAVVSEGFELFQNQPNPFKGQTVIGFNLPESANVTLTIQDAAGKVIRVIRTTGVKGYNMTALNSNELPASGVLYYTIETDGFTATKKMIVLQ